MFAPYLPRFPAFLDALDLRHLANAVDSMFASPLGEPAAPNQNAPPTPVANAKSTPTRTPNHKKGKRKRCTSNLFVNFVLSLTPFFAVSDTQMNRRHYLEKKKLRKLENDQVVRVAAEEAENIGERLSTPATGPALVSATAGPANMHNPSLQLPPHTAEAVRATPTLARTPLPL